MSRLLPNVSKQRLPLLNGLQGGETAGDEAFYAGGTSSGK
jgi:hypothetical protein